MGTITRNAANNFTTGGVILPAAINDTSVASISELENAAAGGAMNLISEQTASGSASIEFTSGIDSTYPIYRFEFINIHPSTAERQLIFNMSTDGGSNYNVTKTTTFFRANHREDDGGADLAYRTGDDLAQSTSYQKLSADNGAGNDEALSGYLIIFNPSSTTFVKHFIAESNSYQILQDHTNHSFIAGYGNTTSSVNAIRFIMETGNIDSGTFKLYGISGS
jgi:hypothetical protein